jgi:hypothetical protein
MASADATGQTKRDKIIKANPFLEHFTVADLRTAWANATSDAAIEAPDEAVGAAPLSNTIVVPPGARSVAQCSPVASTARLEGRYPRPSAPATFSAAKMDRFADQW